jgi:hypothetical protein
MSAMVKAAAAAGMVLVLAGCGGSSLDAAGVVDELGSLYPTPNARDNTGFCAAAGCEQMVTTDAVSVSQWPNEAAAAKWAGAMANSDARQAGRFVLTFSGDQDVTSDEARDAFTRRATELTQQ